jgi:hypothetical protein
MSLGYLPFDKILHYGYNIKHHLERRARVILEKSRNKKALREGA